jgi:ribosomal protein S18 acetylase RimI-like enzyme
MEHIENMARDTGHRTIRLRVFHANRAAALYRRLGYVVESSDEHSAMMSKTLR